MAQKKKNLWWEVFKLVYLSPIQDFLNELRKPKENEEV
jgi:hypothetical protein